MCDIMRNTQALGLYKKYPANYTTTVLNKTDLEKIKGVVSKELDSKLEVKLDQKFDEKLKPFKEEISAKIDERFTSFKKEISNDVSERFTSFKKEMGHDIDKKLKPITADIKKIKRDTAYTVDFLDREDIKLRRRVDRVESVLSLTPLREI